MADGWKWPDYATPAQADPNSTGLPDYAEPVDDLSLMRLRPREPEPQSLWEWGNTPYSDFFSRNLNPIAEEFYRSSEKTGVNPTAARIGSTLGSITKSVGPTLDTMFLSPFGTASLGTSAAVRGTRLASEAAFGINRATGSIPAARTGANIERIGRAIETPQRILSAGYGVQGIQGAVTGENWQEKALGAGQAVLGGLGMRSTFPKTQTVRTPGVRQGEVVTDPYVTPQRQLTSGIYDPAPPAGYRPKSRFVNDPVEGEIIDVGPGDFTSVTPETGISPADSAGRIGRDDLRGFPVQGTEFRPGGNEVSAAQVLGTLKPIDAGDIPLQQESIGEPTELSLRMNEPEQRTGHITYRRENGRNVKLIDGVPENLAGETPITQEPFIAETPENYELLKKFFGDESGTMDFDEMRRRFAAIRKGESLEQFEKKGVAKFERLDDSLVKIPLGGEVIQNPPIDEWSVNTTKVMSGASQQGAADLLRREIEMYESNLANPELKPDGTRRYSDKVYEQDRKYLAQAKAELAELEQSLGKTPEQAQGYPPGLMVDDNTDYGIMSFPNKGTPGSENIKYLSDQPPGPNDLTVPDDRTPKLKPIAGGRLGELPTVQGIIDKIMPGGKLKINDKPEIETTTDPKHLRELISSWEKTLQNLIDQEDFEEAMLAKDVVDQAKQRLAELPKGKLLPIRAAQPRQIETGPDSYDIAKRNLDDRNRRGEVVDYVEELEELNRQYGVFDTMSNEQSKIVGEIRQALDEGYRIYPPRNKDYAKHTAVRLLSDGSKVVGYGPDNLPHQPKAKWQPTEISLKMRDDDVSEMSAAPKRAFKSDPNRPDLGPRYTGPSKFSIGADLVGARQSQEARAMMIGINPKGLDTEPLIEAIYNKRKELGLNPGEEPNKIKRTIAVMDQAMSMGIDPKQFKHQEDLSDALQQARLQMNGGAARIAEAESKLDYYRSVNDHAAIGDLVNQISEIKREATLENTRELLKKYPEILEQPDIAEIIDAAEMKVPGSTNIALGPRMEGGSGLLDALGTALYRRDRASTFVKEGFQNSNDERKISKNTEPIRIAFKEDVDNPVTGEKSVSIVVKDGGRGMNPQQLYTHFSNVGETGKANEVDAGGGFGFAKASPFLGGTLMKVESINKEGGRTYRHEFQGDPAQFKNQQVGVPLTTVQVANSTKTGFTVEVFYPYNQDLSAARRLITKTVKNTPGMDNVRILQEYSKENSSLYQTRDFLNGIVTGDTIELKGEPLKPKVITVSVPGADIDLHYELDNLERNGGEIIYLNNGTYALEGTYSAGWNAPNMPGLPGTISANIKATVEEGQPNYPFTLNREELLGDTETKVKEWIRTNLTEPAKKQKKDELQHLYDTLPTNTTYSSGTQFISLDSGEKYHPDELARFRDAKEVHAVADIMGDILGALTNRFDSTWATFGRTEKFGFRTSQPEDGGVNLANGRDREPDGRRKTAIMINLLGIPSYPSRATPKETAQGIVHAIGHEFAHNKTRPEDEVTWAIYDLFKKWPLEEQMNYAEEIQSAITGPDGNYTPEFERLLQEYSNSRGRPVVKEDILSRQAASPFLGDGESGRIAEMADSDSPKRKGTVRGESKPRKYGGQRTPVKEAGKTAATKGPARQVPITPETESIRHPVTSIQRLKDALQKGNLLRGIESQIQGKERSRRAGMIAGVQTPGTQGYFQKLGMLRGPLPNLPINTELTQGDVDALMTAVNNSTLMPYSKLSAQDGLMRLFSGRIPNQSQTRLLANVFGSDLPELIKLHAGIGLAGMGTSELVYGAVNIPKTFMSGMDLSFTLRQAAPFMLTKEYYKSFGEMWKYFGDEKAFQAAQESIFDDPVYQFFQEFDRPLFISEFQSGTDLTRMEENFGSDLASRLPIYKQTGRMQTAFINKLRFDVAKRLLGEMYESGVIEWMEGQGDKELAERKSRADVQAMLDFVNNFSGRGNIGVYGNIAKLLNASIFSPSFQMSRAHILASPWNYVIKPGMQSMGMLGGETQQVPPAVRKEAWKSMTAIVGFITTGIALTNFFGGEVEDDPNSSDWGKGKFGNTRLDFSQGLQPPIVAAHRIATGKSVSPDRLDKQGRVVQGKEYDLGKTFTGPTIGSVIGNFVLNKTSPIGGLMNVWMRGEQAFAPGGIGGVLQPGKQNMTKAAAINMAVPMVVNDLTDYYMSNPNFSPQGLSFAIAALLGIPMQTYDESKMSKNPFERGFQLRPPAGPRPQQFQNQAPGILNPLQQGR